MIYFQLKVNKGKIIIKVLSIEKAYEVDLLFNSNHETIKFHRYILKFYKIH